MHVTVTKLDNGYLVTSYGDDGAVTNAKAVLKTTVGNVPTRLLGLAVTKELGKCGVSKRSRKSRSPKAASVAAG